MEISALPDSELLEVLKYLSTEQLLQCRSVCRRWSLLALHTTLWLNRRLDYDPRSKFYVAVLSLAPCLRRLIILHSYKTDAWDILLSSSCAIFELMISFQESDAWHVALLLSRDYFCRQASLGRLKEVGLSLYNGPGDDSANGQHLERGLCALLLQICHTPGLESLALSFNVDDRVVRQARSAMIPVPAFLKRLNFSDLEQSPACVLLLLERHAPTLEDVSVWTDDRRVVPLLASMPRLRELQCHLLPDMPLLEQCQLKSLHLELMNTSLETPTVVARLAGARQLLRTVATRLKELSVVFYNVSHEEENLFLGLGEGKTPAALRSLEVLVDSNDGSDPVPSLMPLASILHRLPHLTNLEIYFFSPSDAFLETLDGRVLPGLKKLSVHFPSTDCQHKVAHSLPVQKLLRRYPRLHFIMGRGETERAGCEFCDENACHDLHDQSWVVLFSHRDESGCDVKHSDIAKGVFEMFIDTTIV
ncbi:uncharacterized protein LOC117644958 [Thrips palmi]|uniref:Uncharacterized protein LOC117644958 n=1 Tax=Thrips palmi TaxID=161013 RepID=A0A6P8Z271_THRPL|nr:uncharacterized protein LOC117644958 [Thrips palmi]